MSTSSYDGTGRDCYYATDLSNANFFSTKDSADAATDAQRVNVYVERLAAKVSVNIDESDTEKMIKGNVANVYKIGDFEINSTDVDGNVVTDTKTLYAKLVGWGINSTTKDSYVFKHLSMKSDWYSTFTNFVWNDSDNHRSYWGDSYNYSNPDFYYPSRYQTSYDDDGEQLKYISGNQISNSFGDSDYCNENTNTASYINVKNLHAICTSVLVKAYLTDENGTENIFKDDINTTGEIIKYNGKFYTPLAYRKLVYNTTIGSSVLANYTYGDDDKTVQLTDLQVGDDSILNGRVSLQLTEEAEAYIWKDKSGTLTNNEDIVAAINGFYHDFQKDNDAIGYYEGYMYYSIPIEHMNNDLATGEAVSDAENNVVEAQYGVVRNHLYSLSITGLENVGFGIIDPDEPIIPNPIETEDYYIGATINILAWKTVSQSVVL
jgi:hypothetical protein